MRDRSFYVHKRKPGDCGQAPELAIFYPGTSSQVPVIELGNLVFKGGVSVWAAKAKGIGYDGYATDDNWHKVPFHDILTGGSGVKIRGCGQNLKKKVRLKCCAPNCTEIGERTAIEVRAIASCEYPMWNNWVSPKEVFFQCGCVETCCQRLHKLADEFNSDPDSPVTATVIGWEFIELESKVEGVDFTVLSWEGLTEPDVIVPNFRVGYTAYTIKDWFGQEIVGPCEPDMCMYVVEIFHYSKRPWREHAGTSNPVTDPSNYKIVLETTTVVFQPYNENSMDAYYALLELLESQDVLHVKIIDTAMGDYPTYPYCLLRDDAGDEAALQTAQTDYLGAVNLISLTRSFYENGRSFYSVTSKSGNPPAQVGNDVVNPGFCGADDKPCSEADACEPEI
ncbi:hypothetical protein [Dyadobacter sp. BHUBP1]|uniref:hypothetical protein n=1 Tax=Dyadobacter sp. BHUBP1 TaxID=3424178 RepID=UPI003D32C201